MNAREEFIKHIGSRSVLCAHIQKGDDYDDDPSVFNLTTGWDSEDWSKFLSSLDFEYDAGYGGQNLFGTIWYADGTWSDRDGSEWYEYHVYPPIPKDLNRLDKVREQKLNKIL